MTRRVTCLAASDGHTWGVRGGVVGDPLGKGPQYWGGRLSRGGVVTGLDSPPPAAARQMGAGPVMALRVGAVGRPRSWTASAVFHRPWTA
jgi:hypothetical protein